MTTPSAPRISVIVAARNAEDSIGELLETLRAQTLADDAYEVVVIDDESTDDTAGVVERAGWPVLVRNPVRGGAYIARNLGIAQAARGELLAFTDADCEPQPGWLAAGLAAYDAEPGSGDLLAGRIDVPLRAQPSIAELVDFARYLDQERAVREGGFGATANLFVPRRTFDAVGGFNERLISGGDREFCLRATSSGRQLRYVPDAPITHEPRLTGRSLAKKGFRFGVGRSQARHHGAPVVRARARLWSSPGAYRPGPLYGAERIDAPLTPVKRLQLSLGQWAWVQLPMIAGNVREDFRQRSS